MAQPHRDEPGKLPRALIMCGQHGRLVRRVEEDPDPGNVPPRVVLHRHARANEPLPSIYRPEALSDVTATRHIRRIDQP